jgi:two-component system response regulator AtoC
MDTYLKFIHKLKIIDNTLPILIALKGEAFSDVSVKSPNDDLHVISPELTADAVAQAIAGALKKRQERQPESEPPLIVGKSEGIQDLRKRIKRLSDKDVTLLVTGESGTGKELVARYFHYHSTRNGRPLIKINCAALPDELLESEIFGYQKGAFTGAHKNKPGRLELAHKGTIFFDEVGDLSLSLQAKFLQVLEDREFSRLGDTKDKIIDARIVAATNQDLAKKYRENAFRKDLYYRLNVINMTVPPLRHRKDDIPLLTDYFLNKCWHEFKREHMTLPDKVIKHLQDYHWPGNVREMENIIRKVVILGDASIVFDELCLEGGNMKSEIPNASPLEINPVFWSDHKIEEVFEDNNFSMKKTSRAFTSEVERHEIMKALNLTNWNRKNAAKLLQVSYKTLLNRITEFNI